VFNGLGDILNEKSNNIKNMRDEFDPYFSNKRKGWYQRPLRASRQQVFDEFENFSDVELELYVKKILGIVKGGFVVESINVLEDLGKLIRESTVHYNQDFVWQDVELTNEFKDAYEEYLDKNKWKIEYYNSTSVITTPTTKNIFVPNQWFAIASYAVGVYSELHKYKGFFEQVSDAENKKFDVYSKQLRDNGSSVDKVSFIDSGRNIFFMECHEENKAENAARRLWRFATDYSWWSGQKTVDRGDFYLSVVLNMLNLVNASQSYVGDIVNAYGSDPHLRNLTRRLESFTTNMEGITYDFILKDDKSDELLREEPVYMTTGGDGQKHKIKISANSIAKIGGK
jgi:hypothetical protein